VKPRTDPAFNHRLLWREIAPRPSDPAEAWAVLYAVVDQHVGRLKELLARNEAIEAAEDPDWADRAHRRYQSAKTRELLRTLDTLRRMRNGEKADGKCQMADDECQLADDKCQMADDEWQMANDECREAEGGCREAEGELQVAEGELKMGDEQCEVEAGGRDERESSEPIFRIPHSAFFAAFPASAAAPASWPTGTAGAARVPGCNRAPPGRPNRGPRPLRWLRSWPAAP
jgi:hypothetical protein